jgi:hypothetical protein
MAMKDIKSITVAPEDEESSVRLFQSFGWELKSTQEMKTQDAQVFTGQDSDGSEHYQTTKGEHYIKLTFERDPARQNYAELKSLEGQYYSINDPDFPEKPKVFGLPWIILSVVGLFLSVFGLPIFLVPVAGIIIWRLVRYSKNKKLWNEAYSAYEKDCAAAGNKRSELLSKAQSFV